MNRPNRRRTLMAVIAASLLLIASLATAALARGVGRGPASVDSLEPNLVLYAVETNSAFFDACPFISEEETPEERDARCAEEAEQPEGGEDEELPDPWVGVLDTIAVDEETYFDETRQNLAGVNKILCTQHFTFTILCEGTLALHDGNLFWSAYIDFTALEGDEGDEPADGTPPSNEGEPETPFATAAITGGTGAYLGAEGHVDIFETSEPDAEQNLSRYEVHVVR